MPQALGSRLARWHCSKAATVTHKRNLTWHTRFNSSMPYAGEMFFFVTHTNQSPLRFILRKWRPSFCCEAGNLGSRQPDDVEAPKAWGEAAFGQGGRVRGSQRWVERLLSRISPCGRRPRGSWMECRGELRTPKPGWKQRSRTLYRYPGWLNHVNHCLRHCVAAKGWVEAARGL